MVAGLHGIPLVHAAQVAGVAYNINIENAKTLLLSMVENNAVAIKRRPECATRIHVQVQ